MLNDGIQKQSSNVTEGFQTKTQDKYYRVIEIKFLVAFTRLCKSLCRFVGRSVRPSVRYAVHNFRRKAI